MTKSRNIRWPKHRWSDADLALLREHFPHMPTRAVAELLGLRESQVYQQAHARGIRKDAQYLASPAACRLRRGDSTGVAHRFQRGIVPFNKGLRRPGWAPGRMAQTQFKKGERRGRAAMLYQPVGAERLSKDGYLQKKINDGMPFQSRWRGVHILAWEAANGPLPRGHALVFRNGDRTDIRLDNFELLTRAELMRRNSYHTRYPKEIALVIQLRGAVMRRINRGTRHEDQDRRPA